LQEQLENTMTIQLPAEFSRGLVVINEGAKYSVPILPEKPRDIIRNVRIMDNATLVGDVFGNEVHVGSNCLIKGTVFGQKSVIIDERSSIHGNIMSLKDVKISRDCNIYSEKNYDNNILAKNIEISDNCVIEGNIFGYYSIKVGNNCEIDGNIVTVDGHLTVGDNLTCKDILCGGELVIGSGLKVDDNVIWSREGLSIKNCNLASCRPNEEHYRSFHGYEINLNTIRSKKEMDTLRWLDPNKELLQALNHEIPDFNISNVVSAQNFADLEIYGVTDIHLDDKNQRKEPPAMRVPRARRRHAPPIPTPKPKNRDLQIEDIAEEMPAMEDTSHDEEEYDEEEEEIMEIVVDDKPVEQNFKDVDNNILTNKEKDDDYYEKSLENDLNKEEIEEVKEPTIDDEKLEMEEEQVEKPHDLDNEESIDETIEPHVQTQQPLPPPPPPPPPPPGHQKKMNKRD
jgi:carbonic anhydrase/acetyltransferase-like protein (isoleucine patch superfamily)